MATIPKVQQAIFESVKNTIRLAYQRDATLALAVDNYLIRFRSKHRQRTSP